MFNEEKLRIADLYCRQVQTRFWCGFIQITWVKPLLVPNMLPYNINASDGEGTDD